MMAMMVTMTLLILLISLFVFIKLPTVSLKCFDAVDWTTGAILSVKACFPQWFLFWRLGPTWSTVLERSPIKEKKWKKLKANEQLQLNERRCCNSDVKHRPILPVSGVAIQISYSYY